VGEARSFENGRDVVEVGDDVALRPLARPDDVRGQWLTG
jgi:hypothetical protein